MRNVQTLLVILLAFLAAAWLRFGTLELGPGYLTVLLLGLLLSSVIIPATGAFRREFRWALLRKTRRLMAGWAVVVMALVTLAAAFKVTSDYSRIWFGTWVLLAALGLLASQVLEHAWRVRERRRRRHARRVVLVGGGANGERVHRRITQDPFGEVELAGLYGMPWGEQAVAPIDQLPAVLDAGQVDEVWIAAPFDDHALMAQALELLRDAVLDVNVIPDLHQYRLLNQGITEWGGLPVINLSSTPMTGGEMVLKAVFDRLVAALLLVLLSPLLLLIAALVRLDSPGPVLFRQLRHGLGGEAIEVLKFRSMALHQEQDGAVTQAGPGDARITRLGRWLRRTSLDELPQLLNVLRGEMSMVGPRPHAVQHNRLFRSQIPRYMLRHKVKPGITGWAQVNGLRGLTDTPEKMALRIEHDLWYIQNWSLWLDLRILLMTPLAMVHRNAV